MSDLKKNPESTDPKQASNTFVPFDFNSFFKDDASVPEKPAEAAQETGTETKPLPPSFPFPAELFSQKEEPKEEPEEEEKAEPPKPQPKLRRVWRLVSNIVFFLICIVILASSTMFALSNDPQKSYGGYRLYTVKTPSMTPKKDGSSPPGGFAKGAMILVELCSPEEIQVNDIITFIPGRDPNIYLTHRVIEILDHVNEDSGIFFVTKGDANDDADPPISGEMMVGKKILAIPTAGLVLQFMRDNFVLAIILVVSTLGFVLLLRYYFSDPEKKNPKMVSTADRK